MTNKLAARLRYWWITGRHAKRPRRYQSNGWPIYQVISAEEMMRLAANQRSRGKW